MALARIVVDTTAFVVAARNAHDVVAGMTRTGQIVTFSLERGAGMAGSDSGGGAMIAGAYDAAAAHAREAWSALVQCVARLSALYCCSARNYAAAESSSTAGERQMTSVLVDELPATPVPSSLPALPSARSSSDAPIPELPGGGTGLGRMLYNHTVPNGAAAALRVAAGDWANAAAVLRHQAESVESQAFVFVDALLPEQDDIDRVVEAVAANFRTAADAHDVIAEACGEVADGVDVVRAAWKEWLKGAVTGDPAAMQGLLAAQARHLATCIRVAGRLDAASRTAYDVVSAAVQIAATSLITAPVTDAAALAAAATPAGAPPLTTVQRLANGYRPTKLTKTVTVDLNCVPKRLRDDVPRLLALARQGRVRRPGHDNEPFNNSDGRLPARSDYRKYDLAVPGQPRGRARIIFAGDPRDPDAIYYSDHYDHYILIGP
ncbi:ribonuclease domain-containing protein [Jatrophihabitans fulvus]